MAVSLMINGQTIDDVELVIFDKDGTLIDVHHYWANMIKLRSEIVADQLTIDDQMVNGLMDSMGVDVNRMRVKQEGPVGIKKREVVMQAGVDFLRERGINHVDKILFDAFARADELSLGRFDNFVRPIDGLYRCLKMLKSVKCKVAVATTDRTDRTHQAMHHLNIMNEIDFIAGADLVDQPKPSGEIVELICHHLDISCSHSVMVGDADADILSGQAAGCKASIGVASGLTDKKGLAALTPFVTESIKDIQICKA